MGVFSPEKLFAERELINSLGLELPTVTELAAYLANSGIDIDPSVLTEAELVARLKLYATGRENIEK